MRGDEYFDIPEIMEVGVMDILYKGDSMRSLGVPHASYQEFENMLTELKNEYPDKLFSIPRQKVFYQGVSYSVAPTTVKMNKCDCGLAFGEQMKLDEIKSFLANLLTKHKKVTIFGFDYSVHIDLDFCIFYKWKPIYATV